MTSRPAAAAAPSPMTVSSMVRPLAVVIVDMGLLVVEIGAKRKNAFRRRTGRAGVEAVAQRERECTRKSRDWPQISAVIARISRATLQRCHTPFGAVGSFTLSKHPCGILSSYEACS